MRFGYTTGENDEYKLKNPSEAELRKSIESLKVRFRKTKNSDERLAVVYVFVCHGIHLDGKQIVVLRDCNEKTGYYKTYNAEDNIRQYAKYFPNTSHICIFACCREKFDLAKHRGCFCGTYDEAKLYYEAEDKKAR